MYGAGESWKEVIIIEVCGTERHAQEIIALPFSIPLLVLSPPVCESLLTYNPNSFDRDYGVLMRDRKEAGKE